MVKHGRNWNNTHQQLYLLLHSAAILLPAFSALGLFQGSSSSAFLTRSERPSQLPILLEKYG